MSNALAELEYGADTYANHAIDDGDDAHDDVDDGEDRIDYGTFLEEGVGAGNAPAGDDNSFQIHVPNCFGNFVAAAVVDVDDEPV